MTPSISVIVPLFNKRLYIARAVESILQQRLRDWELIVVDDGSDDGSADAVQPFLADSRVRLLRQERKGVSAARNLGMREMQSRICAFLDADDVFLPHHLDGISELARRYPCAGIFGTAYFSEYPDGRHLTRSLARERFSLLDDYFVTARVCGFLPVCASSVAFSRDAFESVGGFLEGVGIGEDVEYYVRVALEYPVAYDSDPSAVYYQLTPASAMTSYIWQPDLPPLVETVLRRGARCPSSAIDYASWILLKHAAAGIVSRNREGARELLNHEILPQSSLRSRRALIWAGSRLPDAALNAYLKVRNWQQDRSKRRSAKPPADGLEWAGSAASAARRLS